MTKKVTKKHNNLKLTKVSGGKSGVLDTITDLGKKGMGLIGGKAPAAAPSGGGLKSGLSVDNTTLTSDQIMALKAKPGFWD